MTKKSDIVIKPLTPYLELILWTCIMTAGLFSIYKLTQETSEKIWYFTTVTFLLISFLLTKTINNRFKKIIITKDSISIKSFLRPLTKHLTRDKIEGYKLSEVYHGKSTIYIIRLLTVDKEQIDIPRDGYKNYDKIKELIEVSGISYLGRTTLPDRNKKIFTWLMTWGLYIIPLAILLILYLIKNV
jgi:hypothetical protein